MNLLETPPCLYIIVALVWAAYQGIRGVREHCCVNSKFLETIKCTWDKFIIVYIHDFAFRFVCTLAGFVALWVAYRTTASIPRSGDISTGQAALIASSFLIAVVGVGGQLHYLILMGKTPEMTKPQV